MNHMGREGMRKERKVYSEISTLRILNFAFFAVKMEYLDKN